MAIEIRNVQDKSPPVKVLGKVAGDLGAPIGPPMGKVVSKPTTASQDLGGYIGRPRLEEIPYTYEATKPWLKGPVPMSRATWYRRRRALAGQAP